MAKYVNISMNVFAIVNVTTMQRHKCYTFPYNVLLIHAAE